ncbi:MAG: ADP-ribose pyrophosphatase, partial [uncultured Craurococcus sp.]
GRSAGDRHARDQAGLRESLDAGAGGCHPPAGWLRGHLRRRGEGGFRRHPGAGGGWCGPPGGAVPLPDRAPRLGAAAGSLGAGAGRRSRGGGAGRAAGGNGPRRGTDDLCRALLPGLRLLDPGLPRLPCRGAEPGRGGAGSGGAGAGDALRPGRRVRADAERGRDRRFDDARRGGAAAGEADGL